MKATREWIEDGKRTPLCDSCCDKRASDRYPKSYHYRANYPDITGECADCANK